MRHWRQPDVAHRDGVYVKRFLSLAARRPALFLFSKNCRREGRFERLAHDQTHLKGYLTFEMLLYNYRKLARFGDERKHRSDNVDKVRICLMNKNSFLSDGVRLLLPYITEILPLLYTIRNSLADSAR